MNDLPRVLFISPCGFNAVSGGGVTFTNLFRGWPAAALALVSDDPLADPAGRCAHHYALGENELAYPWGLSRLRRRIRQAPPTGQLLPAQGRRGIAERLLKPLLGPLPDRGVLTPELTAWIKEFQPQVIYTILGSLGYLDLVRAVMQAFALPTVVHVMDHGSIAPQPSGLLGLYWRTMFPAKLEWIMARAAHCMAIGEMMAEEYQQRFARPFSHFQNTLDPARLEQAARPDSTACAPYRLLYVGSVLSFAQQQSLIDCANAVTELHRQGLPITFEIHTSTTLAAAARQALQPSPVIRLHDGPTDDDRFFALLREADALLLPVCFDAAAVHFIRLSMPTKLPAYLASGTPTLVYAPAGIAQTEAARRHGWALIVDRRDPAQLQAALRQLLLDQPLRQRLHTTALAVARRDHDATTVRTHFQQILREAAAGGQA